MGDGTEYIAQEIGLVKCPKCGVDMVEVIQEDMTEGQQANYEAGFDVPFECPNCEYYGLFNISSIYEREEADSDSFEFGETDIILSTKEESENSKMLGDIIKEALRIESDMERIIELYFVPDEDRRREFSLNILKKEFFTFEQKRKALVRMQLEKKDVLKIDKNLFKEIKLIEEIRNQVAHILGIYDLKNKTYYIKYQHEGKEKKLILNNKFLEDFIRRCRNIDQRLWMVIKLLETKAFS